MTTIEKLEDLIYRGFKETDERLAQQRKELDERIAQERKELDERWKETDERWRATDKRMERIHKQLSKELNGVAESLSRFSEQSTLPAVKRLFSKRGIELERLSANFEEHRKGETMETDIVGHSADCAVLIEVKLRLRQSDVEEFLEKKLPRFFEFFPYFRRPILYGCVAGMSIDKDVDRFAYKRGLFVIAQTGENLRILNDKKFKPRSFAEKEDNRFAKRKRS
jgi:hypothetical protein